MIAIFSKTVYFGMNCFAEAYVASRRDLLKYRYISIVLITLYNRCHNTLNKYTQQLGSFDADWAVLLART